MAAPILQLTDVHLGYGSVRAVRGLDLDVQPGEVVGLIGANGAGKTTTLSGIMGLVHPSAGEMSFRGRSISGLAPEKISRMGIGLVPEGRRIFADFTVAENMRLGVLGRSNVESVDTDKAWINELFPIVEQFAGRPAGQLSGGQQQQLAIARALIAGPELLLLDEPSLGLAPVVVDEMFRALDDVRKKGVSILLVEQRAERTVGFADRSIVMRNGEVVMEIGEGESIEPHRLAAGYFGT